MAEDRAPIILVVARSYREYTDWCSSWDLNPLDGNVVRFINAPNDLRGYRAGGTRLVVLSLPHAEKPFLDMMHVIGFYTWMDNNAEDMEKVEDEND